MEIHRSARKHRISDHDIAHAFELALAELHLEPDQHPPRFALIGPDTSGNFIELIVIQADDH